MKKTSLILALVGALSSFSVGAFQPFVVKKIKVEGLQRVSEAAVLNDLPIHIGQNVTQAEASEAVRALFKTGFFKDVTLARDGDVLVIQVFERPSVSKLTVSGIKDKEKVLKVLREAGLAEGRMYDPFIVSTAQKELEKYYFSKGKYGVKIEPLVAEQSASLMNVKFSITEGDVARIKQIKIIGNASFPESALIKDFHSSKTNWLSWFSNDDQYAKEKLNADLETLRSYYMDRGYAYVQVDSVQVSLTPDKKHIYITLQITEGDKYSFKDMRLAGDFVVSENKLLPLLAPLKKGSSFSRKALLDVKQTIEDQLGSEGYSNSEVDPDLKVQEDTKEIDITFRIKQGKRVYVRRIQITGNATTKDEVLRRELPQMEGTWVSTSQIKEGKEKILRRGYASEIEIETVPIPGTTDQVDLIYKVEEARLGQIGAGLGYSGSEKLMFNFSISQENFFGTGKTVDFSLDKSKGSSNYAFGYQDPYFTIDGIGMGFSGYYNKSHLSRTSNISDYITDTVGAEVRFVFPMSKYDAFDISLGYDNTHLKIDKRYAARELVNFVNKFGHKFDEYILGLGWRYNSLDQRIFPKSGLMQSLAVRFALPGAKQQHYKATYEVSWFRPISDNERWIVNLASSLGYGNGYGKTPMMPFYRHFFAGGTRFVRGFEENSLGPKDTMGRSFGGNAMVAGTAALIFPNPIKPDAKSVRTALFFDAGQVYDTRDRGKDNNGLSFRHKSNGLRYSLGVSLAWHSPLGAPLTFSLAKPLNVKAGDERRTFNFWMGTQF
jgi:outer membrane protein insertion porin family